MGVNIYISECMYNFLPVWARGEKNKQTLKLFVLSSLYPWKKDVNKV